MNTNGMYVWERSQLMEEHHLLISYVHRIPATWYMFELKSSEKNKEKERHVILPAIFWGTSEKKKVRHNT